MEMKWNWGTCLSNKSAKKISADDELASSLRKTSEKKFCSSNRFALDDDSASSIVSLAYDSVRELLEAISLENGYKIYNHVCYTAFLKEILNKLELAEEFDELRIIRNDINYYGKDVSVNEAKGILLRLGQIRKELLKL